MAPVAFVGAALVAWSVPTSRDPDAHKTDGPGLVLSSAAMALLIYTIIEAPVHGWTSVSVLAPGIAGLTVLAGFLPWERTSSHPMLNLAFFRRRSFSVAVFSVGLVTFSLIGTFSRFHTIRQLPGDGAHLMRKGDLS